MARKPLDPAYRRHPIATALVSSGVLALGFLVALNADHLPLIGNGSTHHAHFTEASGLNSGAEVRIAGVRVGEVTDVELEDDHVDVAFTAGDNWVGDRTTATVKINSLLGQKYLAVDPRGVRATGASEPIPLKRTTSLYDVMTALQDMSSTVGRIDTDQLARSFRTISDTARDTPRQVRGAVHGLSALSSTISKRDQQLRDLLNNTHQVANTVQSRNQQFERLLTDGSKLLDEVRQRRQSVHQLLVGTQRLSAQLNQAVEENTPQFRSTMDSLDRVTALLERNQQNLDRALRASGPLYRSLSTNLGNGRWADVYVCGLLPPAVGPANPQGCAP